MEDKPKRPFFVWIALSVLLVLAITWFANGVYLVWYLRTFSFGDSTVYAVLLGLGFWALLTFRAVLRRKKYGRYSAITLFALAWLWSFYNFTLSLNSWPGLVVAVYYPAYLASWVLNLIFDVLLVALVPVFIFSMRVAQYFALTKSLSGIELPPPPPTFHD